MTTAAAAERAELCDLFEALGPGVPTLCGDWDARDLAAHLVVRERRPDGAIGILAKPFAGYAEKVRLDESKRPFDELVELVRSGPPLWSPTRLSAVDRAVNTIEFFIHHEDVRRAQAGWKVRSLSPDLIADLLRVLRMARVLTRKSPVGITLVATDAPEGESSRLAHAGDPMVTITGPVGELLLFVYGRKDVAQVELVGTDEAVAAVRAAEFGI